MTDVDLIYFNYRTKEVINQYKRDKADLKYEFKKSNLNKNTYNQNLVNLKNDLRYSKQNANLKYKQYEKEVNAIPKHRLMAEYTTETNPDRKLVIRHRIDSLNNRKVAGKVLKTAAKAAVGTVALAGLGYAAGTAIRAGINGINAAGTAINDAKDNLEQKGTAVVDKIQDSVSKPEFVKEAAENVVDKTKDVVREHKVDIDDLLSKYKNGASLSELNIDGVDPKDYEKLQMINDRAHQLAKSLSGVATWSPQTPENEKAIKDAWDKAIPQAINEFKQGKLKV
jgi:hypothetical protein